jgi:hypothetical protein
MNSRRAFLPVLALVWAVSAPAWASTSGGVGPTDAPATPVQAPAAGQTTGSGGGAEATTVRPGAGGGGAAPAGTGEQPPVADPAGAVAAQDPTPTTPEGQPQDPEPNLPDDEDTPADEDQPADDGADQDDEAGATLPNDGDGTSTLGFLPTTGLEVAALAVIGLGLMIAGFALLRPTTRPRRPRTLR